MHHHHHHHHGAIGVMMNDDHTGSLDSPSLPYEYVLDQQIGVLLSGMR